MLLNLGSSGFCRPHTQNQTQSKCAHDLRMPRGFKRVFVFMLRPQYMQVTNAPDETRLFWWREKPEDPQIQPHAGIKMAQGQVSLVYIWGKDRDYFFPSLCIFFSKCGCILYVMQHIERGHFAEINFLRHHFCMHFVHRP